MSLDSELFNTLKPMLRLCQISGLFIGSLYEFNVRKVHKITYFLALFVLFLVSYFIYLFIYYYPRPILRRDIIINQYAKIIAVYSYSFLMFAHYVFNFTKKTKFIQFLNQFNEISIKFGRFNIAVDYNPVRHFLKYCFYLLSTVYIIYFFKFNFILCRQQQFSTCFNVWLSFFFPPKIALIQILLITTCIQILQQHFKAINDTLMVYIEESSKMPQNYLLIKQLQNLHSDLCEIGYNLNSLYSIQLLLAFTNQFITIFTASFFLFYGYPRINGQLLIVSDIVHAIVPLVMLCTPIICTCIITYRCHLTYKENKKTGKLLHRIHFEPNDVFMRSTIQEFSMKLLHDNFEMTAFGCFKIDMSLVNAIVDSVTTYLIILIELHHENQHLNTV